LALALALTGLNLGPRGSSRILEDTNFVLDLGLGFEGPGLGLGLGLGIEGPGLGLVFGFWP